jgi:hypothetical protein
LQQNRMSLGIQATHPSMTRSNDIASRILSFGAWSVLVIIVLGYASLIPSVSRALDDLGPLGRFILTLALLFTGLAALLTWIGAVWHALARRRRALAVVLVVGNFVTGFFYYFGYVLWQRRARADA